MELTKRQTSNSFSDCCDTKRQKIQITTDETNCLSKELMSCFEDLSNELIYEIFEFVDYFQLYEAFINLNQRFQNLLIDSNLPIKINLSTISKSNFERYNKDIIEPNIHRISSLHFSDTFSYEFILLSIPKLSEFSRLETLIFYNIGSKYIDTLLDQLSSLSLLSSLTITTVDTIQPTNMIYHKIFRLPALKYCKLPVLGLLIDDLSAAPINQHSSIEHLIINDSVSIYQLGNLLSYVPYLRRLSCRLIQATWEKRTETCSIVLQHLTHLSCELGTMKFDRFTQVIKDFFPTIEVLHCTLTCDRNDAYLNMDKWKQLIISHIPYLRIFDIKVQIPFKTNDDQLAIETEINQFMSPFWIERQWFFAQHFYETRFGKQCIFYSTSPYRRKYYILGDALNVNTFVHHHESNLNSVQNIRIFNDENILNCMKYFPNATELIFKDDFSIHHTSITSMLNRIIPLKQLTKLVVDCHSFSFDKIIELLYNTPNIHSLEFISIPFYKLDDASIEENETFRFVSNTNNITHLTFKDKCTVKKLKLLLTLCPRIQNLTINTRWINIISITRFLLDSTNSNTRCLYSLCFVHGYNGCSEKIDALIKSEKLLDDYTLQMIDKKLYIWW